MAPGTTDATPSIAELRADVKTLHGPSTFKDPLLAAIDELAAARERIAELEWRTWGVEHRKVIAERDALHAELERVKAERDEHARASIRRNHEAERLRAVVRIAASIECDAMGSDCGECFACLARAALARDGEGKPAYEAMSMRDLGALAAEGRYEPRHPDDAFSDGDDGEGKP